MRLILPSIRAVLTDHGLTGVAWHYHGGVWTRKTGQRLVSHGSVPGVLQWRSYPLVGAATVSPVAPLQADLRAGLVADPLIEMAFRIPQSEGAALAALEAGAVVQEKRFEGNLAFFRAVGPASLLERYRQFYAR